MYEKPKREFISDKGVKSIQKKYLFRTKLSFLSNKCEISYICENIFTMKKVILTADEIKKLKEVKQKQVINNEIVKK